MTLPIERARSRRPVTWLTIVGVLLLPVVIGGILVAALYNPTERLSSMHAAIVNEDQPVTINGQMVPLGRQLTAGLVKGSDTLPSNLDWTISNSADAKAGLADGTYQSVITIPANFSAAATSTAPGKTPETATIRVQTAPDSLVVDDAISAQVTQAAASLMGQQLSQVYLERVFLGFTTLGDNLGTAADGATTWADGARKSADGAASLAAGIRKLSGGATDLATGANGISSGLSTWSSGATTWAGGATSAANGLDTWAAGANQLAGSTATLAGSLSQIATGLSQAPTLPQQVVDGANQLAANSEQIKTAVTSAADQLTQLAAECEAQGGSPDFCAQLADTAATANGVLPTVTAVIDQSDAIAQGVNGLSQLPQLAAGLSQISTGMDQVSGGMTGLASGASDAAAGVQKLAGGASSLAGGAAKLSDGAAQWSSGADAWASGATQTADGTDQLATGIGKLADGADSLASGLHKAADSLPSYTDAQATSLAKVVSDPVTAKGVGADLFGASAIPLLAMLALWIGGIASFIALGAVTRRTLTSRAPSALLALRNLAPAAAIGAVQGLLVAGVVQLAASYDWGQWSIFAGISVLAGIAFAAVNQALVAVFGGAGRWIAALVGVLAVGTGVVSTVPGVLSAIAGLMPTAPAYNAMVAALTSASGVGAGAAGLVIWSLLAFIATVVTVARRRTVSARTILASAPA